MNLAQSTSAAIADATFAARMSWDDVAAAAVAAHERERARALHRPIARRDVWKGGEVNRLVDDWIATVMHPNDEVRWSLRRLRARARELERNNSYARAYLNALAVNVLGPNGPKLQAQIRDNPTAAGKPGKLNKRLNDRAEAAWADWAERPTVDQTITLGRFQDTVLRTLAREGEAFVRLHRGYPHNRFRFALEPIDPDMLDETMNEPPRAEGGTEVVMGIEIDGLYGRPLAYHFWKKAAASGFQPRTRFRAPASEVIHLYDPMRVNAARGVTWMVPVMWPLHMLQGYMESEAVAARAGAAKMGFWTRDPEKMQAGEIPVDPKTNTLVTEASPGTFDFGPEGYKLETWDTKHPNTAYPEFVKSKLREVASGLGMSYNALANDLENVNYSSMRSGLLVERSVWRAIQRFWIDAFLTPVYRVFVAEAMLSGELVMDNRDFRKFQAVSWGPHGWPWVDPKKETEAGVLAINNGLDCHTDLLAEQGKDFERVLENLAHEKEMAAEYGVDISGKLAAPASTATEGDDEDEDDEEKPTSNGNRNGGAAGRNRVRRALAGRTR